jgi:uncharacterized protein (DUF885 family)
MLIHPKKFFAVIVSLFFCFAAGCRTADPPAEVFQRVAEPFVFGALAMTPIEATEMGYHEHVVGGDQEGKQSTHIELDSMLDDYSPEGVQKRIQFLKDFQTTLHEKVPDRNRLAGEAFADYAVAQNLAARDLFELEEVKTQEHNPVLYVQLLGRALYDPFMLEYASKPDRFRHIIARLGKVPEFLNQAKQNLKSSPAVWTEAARSENDGSIRFVERTLAAEVPQELKADYDAAAKPALEALRDFNNYLDTDLAKRNQDDWRLGPELYAKKLKLWTGNADKTPDQILSEAEAELETVTKELIETARPVHKEIYGNQRPPTDDALIRDVLDVVSDENRLKDGSGLLDQVNRDIEDDKKFVQDKELAPLPPGNNLKVIETPEFLRANNPVANFLGAPPLQPTLSALFMVTPIPSDWPRARELSKLREYNLYQLRLLTIEYAIPGHYVAREFANATDPLYRRVLRAQGNPAFNDGWGAYMTDSAVGVGLPGGNELKVIFIKQKMRIITDAIVDIRMHTKNMSEDDAMKLLQQKAYQEVEGARDKIQRVRLTSARLPLQYFGWKQWLRVRDHYQNETQDFSLRSFHEKALRAGPMPFPDLGYVTAQVPMQ